VSALLPTISTIFIVISAVFVAYGWYLIKQGLREKHMKVMILGAVFALAFFLVYLSKTIFVGSTKFGGPEYLQVPYFIFLITHIILASVAAVFGIITLTFGFKQKFAKHRKIGKWTSIIWFITAASGVMVYCLLYILFPGEEADSLIHAIFG
jgi:putative membrane protein